MAHPTPPNAPSRPAAELLALARRARETGQWLLAFDHAKRGLAADPQNRDLLHEAAKALINLGALGEAGQMLARARAALGLDDAALADMAARCRQAVAAGGGGGGGAAATVAGAEETLGLTARVLKDTYRQTRRPDDARRCKQAYLAAFAASGGYWTCVNVAAMARVLAARDAAAGVEELADARLFADVTLRACDAVAPASAADAFWLAATRGEARLVVGDATGATDAYRAAAAITAVTLDQRESVRRQLRLLEDHGVAVPPAVHQLFRPPAVVCFTGHMVDAPGRPAPRFPAWLAEDVRAAVAAAVDALAAPSLIGYCSAACGGDLLFAELMLERGAELQVVLPFDAADFVQTSVAFAGPDWVRRYERVLADPRTTVTSATTEPYLGTDALFGHCNRVMAGAAWLRAGSFGVEPHLVAALDPASAAAGSYGAQHLVDLWAGAGARPVVIDVGRLRTEAGPPPAPAARPTDHGEPPPGSSGAAVAVLPRFAVPDVKGSSEPGPAAGPALVRAIKTLMFADIRGFSGLAEAQVPLFMFQVFGRLAAAWEPMAADRLLLETWGDAVYCVLPTATAAAEHALAMQAVMTGTDWAGLGLPAGLAARVSLHAGPAFEGVNPLKGGRAYYGSHVTRAARIEPVTLPGRVYATLPFVALLTAERAAAAAAGSPAAAGPGYRCEYVGQVALDKQFGTEPLYQVREA